MDKMTKEELLRIFDSFINEEGLVGTFMDFLDSKGYLESEYDELIEDL